MLCLRRDRIFLYFFGSKGAIVTLKVIGQSPMTNKGMPDGESGECPIEKYSFRPYKYLQRSNLACLPGILFAGITRIFFLYGRLLSETELNSCVYSHSIQIKKKRHPVIQRAELYQPSINNRFRQKPKSKMTYPRKKEK
jgi:hypothetical protein